MHSVLKPFPCAFDGIHVQVLEVGSTHDFGSLADGLKAAGYIGEVLSEQPPAGEGEGGDAGEGASTAESGAEDPQADTTSREPGAADVDIPENWAELGWNDLRALAAKLTTNKVGSKADAIAAVEAELKARSEPPAEQPPAGEGEGGASGSAE